MEPKLRVRASGFGGSGYKHPVTGNVVPGVTTVLKNLNKPGVLQWAVDNTAAYAVANVDGLLNRTEEQGYGFLRWYWKRDPLKGDLSDIRNYSNGVLEDSANLGTMMHDWIAADHGACPYPDVSLAPSFFWEMVEEWEEFQKRHEVKPVHSEITMWNDEFGYAGTADGVWEIDGKLSLIDIKTSRNTWDEHLMQLIALHNCETLLIEESEGKWKELDQLVYDQMALVHIRPTDTDKQGNPMAPFAELKSLDNNDEHELLWEGFTSLVRLGYSLNGLQDLRKRRNK